jgi:LysR family pca operon transcriptional activator
MRRYLDQQLKLRQLRAIAAIASHGSLLRASRTLGVSQPALTKTLHEAEEIVGGRLFERHPRGVQATVIGDAVIQAARRILAEIHQLDAELDRISSRSGGTIALGALPVAAGGVLPGALARLKQTYPDIIVRLVQGVTEDLLPALAAGDLDMVVGRLYEPVTPDGLVRECFYNEPISIVARAQHPIFAVGVPTLDDIRGYDLILPTIGQRIGQEIEHILVAMDLPPALALRSTSSTFIREMLYSTDLLSVMPELMMVGDLMRGAIRVLPLPRKLFGPPRPAGLILRKDRHLPPAGEALLECLREHLADMSAKGLTDITGIDTVSRTRHTTAAQS